MTGTAGVAQASHKPALKRMNLSWQEHAACVDSDPDLFSTKRHFAKALIVCGPCPVKAQCAQLGQGAGEGVWGGQIQTGTPSIGVTEFLQQKCGTYAGWKRHKSNDEQPCLACLQASADYTARRA